MKLCHYVAWHEMKRNVLLSLSKLLRSGGRAGGRSESDKIQEEIEGALLTVNSCKNSSPARKCMGGSRVETTRTVPPRAQETDGFH